MFLSQLQNKSPLSISSKNKKWIKKRFSSCTLVRTTPSRRFSGDSQEQPQEISSQAASRSSQHPPFSFKTRESFLPPPIADPVAQKLDPINRLKIQKTHAEELHKQNLALAERHNDLEFVIDQLTRFSHRSVDTITRQESRLSQLESAQQQKEQDCTLLQTKLDQTTQELQAALRQLELQRAKILAKDQQLEQQEIESNQLQTKLDQTTQELQAALRQLELNRKEILAKDQQIGQLEENLSKLDHVQHELQQILHKLELVTRENHTLGNELHNKQEIIQGYRKDLSVLQNQLDDHQKRIDELDKQNLSLSHALSVKEDLINRLRNHKIMLLRTLNILRNSIWVKLGSGYWKMTSKLNSLVRKSATSEDRTSSTILHEFEMIDLEMSGHQTDGNKEGNE